MRKIVAILAAALTVCACRIEDSTSSNRTSSELEYLMNNLLRDSAENSVYALISLDEEDIFEAGFKDTVETNYGRGRVALEKWATPDSTWSARAVDSDNFSFTFLLTMQPEEMFGYNDFKITGTGSYQESPYIANFGTEGDFYLRWENINDYFLQFSYQAVPHGKFKIKTFLDSGQVLDELTKTY